MGRFNFTGPFKVGSIAYCRNPNYVSVEYGEPVKVLECREYEGMVERNVGRYVIDVAHLRGRRYQHSSYFASNFTASHMGAHTTRWNVGKEGDKWDFYDAPSVSNVDRIRAEMSVHLSEDSAPKQDDLFRRSPLHVAYRLPPRFVLEKKRVIKPAELRKMMTLTANDELAIQKMVDTRIQAHPSETWVILAAHSTADRPAPVVLFHRL